MKLFHKCDGCEYKSEHQEMGFKSFGVCTKLHNLIEAQKAYEAEECPFQKGNGIPTMRATVTFLKSLTVPADRENSKGVMIGHINNICSAVLKQIGKDAIKTKAPCDIKIRGKQIKKNVTIYQCPICFNYIMHGQRYCDKCGQLQIYDY